MGGRYPLHSSAALGSREARLDQMRDCFDEKQKHGRLQHGKVGKFRECSVNDKFFKLEQYFYS